MDVGNGLVSSTARPGEIDPSDYDAIYFYEKALLPFTTKVVVDGRLVTGQNPQSARATAEQVAALL